MNSKELIESEKINSEEFEKNENQNKMNSALLNNKVSGSNLSSNLGKNTISNMNNFNQNLLNVPEEILAFRDKAWDTYHSSEKYLNLLENKFGQKARDELDSTKTIKLKRKLLGD